jgi:D-alanyl-D-alanine carboxypeptidase (penicillin-binding protein 5/6)
MFVRVGLCLLFPYFLVAEPLKFQIKGESAILMNAETGAILFEHDARIQRYPASTTKIATALYALKLKENDLDFPVTAEHDSVASITQEAKRQSNYTKPSYWLEPDGMHMGIKNGEILSLRDLLKGMMIASGNDAANVIAQALGPSIPVFMNHLNTYLQELGCAQTRFCNPHGLHDPKHQTTAYDLALMTQEALKNPTFREMVAQPRFLRPKTNKQAATTLLQTNRLIRPGKFNYSKAIGVKTGWHAKAKNNIVGAAESDGRTLIVVLMGYQDRDALFQDAIQLFETAFNQPKVQRIYLKEGLQTFTQNIPKTTQPLQTYLAEALTLDYYPAEDPQVKCLLYWDPVKLPIMKGERVGELKLVDAKGAVLKSAPLRAVDTVRLSWPYSWWARLSSLWWSMAGLLGLTMIILLILLRKTARR